MKKFIILTNKGLDCRVLLEDSELWLGREAIDVNNRETTARLVQARQKGEGVFEDKKNIVAINY